VKVIPKRLDEVDESDLDILQRNSVSEGKTLEYKQSLPANADLDKKEFLADVSSFANTAGGDLIFGVIEQAGVPSDIPGLTLADLDAEVRRLDSIIADGLEPRVKWEIRCVQRNGGPPVLIVRTERSWIGPHRVIFKGQDRFYSRNSGGKYPMDVSELRSAFTLASALTDRVRQFRVERIEKIRNNQTPVPLVRGTSRTVLHCIPLESFSGPVQYDVLRLSRDVARLPPLGATTESSRINLDGVVTYNRSGNTFMSYAQLFRNGAIEGVETHWLNVVPPRGEGRKIPYIAFEGGILRYLEDMLSVQKSLGVNPPIAVTLTMTDTSGVEMASDPISDERGSPIVENELLLPESLVESFIEPPSRILKPLFDLVWNACGYSGSKNFDRDGNWSPRR
jgi:hypothetical protein